MKKGISIWSFGSKTLKEAFTLAKSSGFDGVEVALGEDGEINLGTVEKELAQIKILAASCGIQLYSVALSKQKKFINDILIEMNVK